jgi:hypothetical protein
VRMCDRGSSSVRSPFGLAVVVKSVTYVIRITAVSHLWKYIKICFFFLFLFVCLGFRRKSPPFSTFFFKLQPLIRRFLQSNKQITNISE